MTARQRRQMLGGFAPDGDGAASKSDNILGSNEDRRGDGHVKRNGACSKTTGQLSGKH